MAPFLKNLLPGITGRLSEGLKATGVVTEEDVKGAEEREEALGQLLSRKRGGSILGG